MAAGLSEKTRGPSHATLALAPDRSQACSPSSSLSRGRGSRHRHPLQLSVETPHVVSHRPRPHLRHHVESETVDVVEIPQPKEGSEGAAGQHSESQVIPDGQALPYYAAEDEEERQA